MDKLMGNISYGVFLNHFAVLWILENTSLGWPKKPLEMAVFLFICTGLGAFSYFMVERPLLMVRRRIRLSKSEEAVNAGKVLRA
jgi:peptidoglycan/LPS O-acetylase OafA/YrhL